LQGYSQYIHLNYHLFHSPNLVDLFRLSDQVNIMFTQYVTKEYQYEKSQVGSITRELWFEWRSPKVKPGKFVLKPIMNKTVGFFNKEITKIIEKDFERKNTAVLSKGIILLII